jgi:hypothetical protein
MNNRGNWMFVVNLNEVDDRYTQLVGTETCAWVYLTQPAASANTRFWLPLLVYCIFEHIQVYCGSDWAQMSTQCVTCTKCLWCHHYRKDTFVFLSHNAESMTSDLDAKWTGITHCLTSIYLVANPSCSFQIEITGGLIWNYTNDPTSIFSCWHVLLMLVSSDIPVLNIISRAVMCVATEVLCFPFSGLVVYVCFHHPYYSH